MNEENNNKKQNNVPLDTCKIGFTSSTTFRVFGSLEFTTQFEVVDFEVSSGRCSSVVVALLAFGVIEGVLKLF